MTESTRAPTAPAPGLQAIDPDETPEVRMSKEVFLVELAEIAKSRRTRGVAVADDWSAHAEAGATAPAAAGGAAVWKPPVDLNLVGLALSGGGIRSSTFGLGLLQSLGKNRTLRHVDYLSTVSGGGYIGSFWSCLLARSRYEGRPTGGQHLASSPRFQENPLFLLEHELGREEDPALQHLRNYANYLAPRGAVDALRFPVLLLRGLVINFLLLLPYLLFAAAAAVYVFEEAIRHGRLAFEFPLTRWLVLVLLGSLVFGGILQSRRRRKGRSTLDYRRKLLRVNTLLFFAALVVIAVEYQPQLIFAVHSMSRGASGLVQVDVLGWITVLSGTVSAIFSSSAAVSARPRLAKLGLWLVGILGPLTLLVVYVALCRWAVFPSAAGTQPWWAAPGVYFALGMLLWLLSLICFDVNATSLHNYYRDCLSRTFLFSRHIPPEEGGDPTRKGDDIRPADDTKLADIDIGDSGGPYHLINAAWNNPNLDERSLRGRRSDFFVFGNRYSGNDRLGYCPTKSLEMVDVNANLGTALAVSAAAAAPNMGQMRSNPFLTFLMAMLNVRLGYWVPSPAMVNRQSAGWPPARTSYLVGPIYFLAELLGLPDFLWGGGGRELGHWKLVNLSDGGHIENLGVFELLRRRCRFIIAVDAEADPEMTFGGLATLVRLGQTDLGIDIDIDVDGLRKDETGLSRRHWILGTINYGDNEFGEFLYIKASVTGSENEYINEYRARHSRFPHESTGDQFFDEVQFEAYRALGYKVGNSLLYRPGERPESDTAADPGPRKLFDELRAREAEVVMRPSVFSHLQQLRREIEIRLTEPALQRYAGEELFHESAAPLATASRAPAALPVAAAPESLPPARAGVEPDDEESELQLYQICNAKL
jgi:hypothetical protein